MIALCTVVYDVKDTKIEWNSQLFCCLRGLDVVVYDVKDTKIEWNSQRGVEGGNTCYRCL